MYKLPFIRVPVEFLVPHEGNSYTLPVKKNTKILVDSVEVDNVLFTDVFIILPTSNNNNLKFATLVILEEEIKTKEEDFILFTALKKIKINSINKKTISFSLEPKTVLTSSDIKLFNPLLTFLKNNKDFNFISNNIDLNNLEDLYLIDKIAAHLNLDPHFGSKFYNLSRFKSKISLLALSILGTLTMFHHGLDAEGQKKDTLYPSLTLEKLNHEQDRLDSMSSSSIDYSNTLDYINLLTSIPWGKYSFYESPVENISNQLNLNHHGLDNVKQQILEYFYLQKLTNVQDGAYLLFDGPPGTGKTSIAKAIAKATNRDFLFISLSGSSDESELRGHRRTYAGSRPGRIVSGLAKFEAMNPVILLDEVDKTSSIANRGDIQGALLEILDKQQNSSFVDRYLEVPIDISKAIIICTSNNKKKVAKPLLDRLSVIDFEEYSFDEKTTIIKDYLFPSALKKYKMQEFKISLEEDLLDYFATNFSLRNIESAVLRLLRWKAKNIILNNGNFPLLNLNDYLTLYPKKSHSRRIGFANNLN
jgi:hypothetical protein